MALPNVTVGTVVFKPISIPDAPFDPAIWRADTLTIPPMYRATIEHKATLNSLGTNVNETITVKVPEVSQLAGAWSVLNTHVASARVSALQNTTDVVSATLAIDTLIGVLTSRKAQILAGSTV